jgi:hypothetical protein
MKIYSSHELKDMGKPIKETDCWLFFEKGKMLLLRVFILKMKLKDLELSCLLININQSTTQLINKRKEIKTMKTQIKEFFECVAFLAIMAALFYSLKYATNRPTFN